MALKPADFGRKKVYNDAMTGREVWQMTSGEYTSHATYMYCQAFTRDEKYIIFSSNRTGSFQLYRMDVESGEAMQVTGLDNYNSLSMKIGTTGREAYVTAGSAAHIFDVETGETEPFLVMPKGYRATHEYWAPDGSKLYFHKKQVPGWVPASIGSIPKEGGDMTIYFTSDSIKLGHSSVNPSQTKIVSDDQEPDKNQLILIDIPTGRYETLCWTNTSGTEQYNHVHPSFSPTGRKVIFTSDTSGSSQVYIVPL